MSFFVETYFSPTIKYFESNTFEGGGVRHYPEHSVLKTNIEFQKELLCKFSLGHHTGHINAAKKKNESAQRLTNVFLTENLFLSLLRQCYADYLLLDIYPTDTCRWTYTTRAITLRNCCHHPSGEELVSKFGWWTGVCTKFLSFSR